MTVDISEYPSLREAGYSRAKIAETFGIPEWKLKKLVSANNLGKVAPVVANKNAFDEYSESAAYWAGFIAADGCVDSKSRIRVMLNYDDLEHLEKLKRFLGSTHKISVNTTTYYRCSLEITNSYICDILELNYSIVPNKTAILKFPLHIPKKYMKHYIRGYFDGDGSICESFSNVNSRTASLYATFASGCESFSLDLFEYLQAELNLGGHLQSFKDSVKWQIKFNTNDAKTLLHYMYKDSEVYLDRKYALYQRLVVENNRETR